MKPFLIVNPASASGRTGRHFDSIARAVRSAVGDFECAFTRSRGDGVRLARQAVAAGGELLVAVGGDGTASEVIDGMLSSPSAGGGAQFGFIPRGTGGDLRRTIGIAPDVAGAAQALASRNVAVLDLGRIECVGPGGEREVRHFANVAGMGISGVVSRMVNHGLRRLPSGKVAFMLASATALLTWSDQPVRWRIDGGEWHEERLTALSVCNGRYFGGGMLVAPEARMDDGLFDVVVWEGFGFGDLVVKRPMLYDGRHVQLPNTRVLRGRVVEAEPMDGAQVHLDVDGENPGTLPARFSIIPGGLRIRVGA